MTKQSLSLVLSACALLGIACNEGPLEPEPATSEPEEAVLSALRLLPAQALLFALAPDDTVQLRIEAYDQEGRRIRDAGAPTYSGSAPAIAEVDSSGLVRALAPGATEITATLTREGVTETASMIVVVQPSVLSALRLLPTQAFLFAVAPEHMVQLRIEAFDQGARRIPDPGSPTYSTSAPAIAEVDSSGLVAALAPGTTEVTATLTREGAIQTASMIVVVMAEDRYDLTASITSFDPAWGDLTGFRYTGVLALRHDPTQAPGIGGTYSDLRVTAPTGETHMTGGDGLGSGNVRSYLDFAGRLVIELEGYHFHFYLGPRGDLSEGDSLAAVIEGQFGTGGHITGPFRLERRQEG